MRSKLVAVTMGDPAGIGPEVVVKALATERTRDLPVQPVVVGDARVIRAAAESAGVNLDVVSVADLDVVPDGDHVVVLDLANADPAEIQVGRISAAAGRASMEAIERATALTRAGAFAALVTAPINKEATNAAGYHDVGHMEYLARVTATPDHATMLVTKSLRVVHLTTHYSLKRACDLVTKDRVLGKLLLTHQSFVDWGLRAPRIAAAALNPHGGEGGLFGDEEMTAIRPAVEQAKAEGVDARGPYPADSVFNRAIDAEFDVVLAMYHDQGHIPIKVHGFAESVSVALGLPLIRTSVDHGTAFDIAGKNVADATSMVEALVVAAQIVDGTWLR